MELGGESRAPKARYSTELQGVHNVHESQQALLQRLANEVLTGHNLAALDEIFHADYVEDEPPPGMDPSGEGLLPGPLVDDVPRL